MDATSARGAGHRVRANHLHGPHGLWRIRTSGGLAASCQSGRQRSTLCLWEQIFPAETVTGGALRWVTDNRVAAFGVVLLMGSAAQSLTSSGAFEIYFNGTCHFQTLKDCTCTLR